MKPTHKVIRDVILKAIKEKTECYITFKNDGIKVFSYRYATELHSILKQPISKKITDKDELLTIDWYHVNYSVGLDGNKESVEQGTIIIEWEKVRLAKITENSGRVLVNIDDLEINFLDSI